MNKLVLALILFKSRREAQKQVINFRVAEEDLVIHVILSWIRYRLSAGEERGEV